MSSSTQPLRRAFRTIQPNVPRVAVNKTVTINRPSLVLDAEPYKSRKQYIYSISDLLSFKPSAVPYTLPLAVICALSEKSEVPYKTPCKRIIKSEEDPKKLDTRHKQVSYGKVTEGYANYVKFVPVSERIRGDPKTPDIHQSCSKRSWDGQVRKWRRALHAFDDIKTKEELDEVRKRLVVINATPNKLKVPSTEPIHRARMLDSNYIPRSLTFDDLE
ncbi:hypothetical protein ENUP19_0158G0043 [Entamoeba nuttalli]|uniref:Histone RNA hairpin-binding protein, putative n=2 Tax=Entamoeba nuttalli TaxID=412467 RepID=K2HGA4_ENTNP|nr:histone RNA hairpin-binding protein, putative [Entamoeba nuttalli P19]EKE41919.1 histone RNA hairpin-binding protein, putative [Entamoeba nuttalli P19]|eukprot:XP_008855744.1 histone RNA hairpin-binding protein, putative [Entamoeba nuttalli P19]